MEGFEETIRKAILFRINRTKEDPNWTGNGYIMDRMSLASFGKIIGDQNCRVVIFTIPVGQSLKNYFSNSGIIVHDGVSSNEEVLELMKQYSADDATIELAKEGK